MSNETNSKQSSAKSTSKKSLSKQRKSIIVIVAVVAVIGLISWSVVEKLRRDKENAIQQTANTEKAKAKNEANQLVAGKMSKADEEECSRKSGMGQGVELECRNEKQTQKLDQLMTSQRDKFTDEEIARLVYAKLLRVRGKNIEQKLDKIQKEFDDVKANYIYYLRLSSAYTDVNLDKAIANLKKSRQLYEAYPNKNPNDDENSLADYDRMIKRLEDKKNS